MKNKEYILCSAIWLKELERASDRPINTPGGVVVGGFRHGNSISSIVALTGKKLSESGEHIQGFLTSLNRFVDREEAWIIAEKANQIIKETSGKGTLYSENLW